ncbi:sialic acid-binding Ig-like lectin 12 [Lampetra planeri]
MDVLQTSLLLCLVGGSLHLNDVAGYDWGVKYQELVVTATEGRDVDLPCDFWLPRRQGPVARVRWTRDGTDVTADNLAYSSTSTEVAKSYMGRTSLSDNLSNKICTLKINNVRVSDVATYFFTFETNTREFTGTAGVQLRVKCARFNDAAVSYGPSAEVRVQEGGRALLPCAFCFRIYNSVRGFWLIKDRYDETTTGNIVYSLDSGASLIDWYKGRVALVGSLSSGSCSLEIRDAMRKDSRTYFFRANIDGTKFSGIAGIKVTVVDRSFTPNTGGSKRIRENVGTRANLKCTTTRLQQADNFKWWKYRSDGRYEKLSETRSDLTFEAVAVKDVGWYECEAWSSSANSESSWTELQVLSFLPASPGLRAAVPATLVCSVHTVSRLDSVTIRWVLDDDVKWTNSTSQDPSPDGTFTVSSWLSFTPSPEDDGKRWHCEASGGDVASTTVQDFILDIKYAPVVMNVSQDETCGGEGDVCLFCEVKAHPRAAITWWAWGSDVPEWTQDGKETLTWSSVVIKKSQEKNVTCVAANVVGETKAVFYIKGGAGAGCWCVLSLLAPMVAWMAVGVCLLLLWRGVGKGDPGAYEKARPIRGTDTEGIRMEVATPLTGVSSPN